MEWNPIGTTAASLGSALGQGISAPIKQAMELLGQKKLFEIQNNAKLAQTRDLRNRREEGYKTFLPNLAGFLADQSDTVQKAAMENIGELIKIDRMLGLNKTPDQPSSGNATNQQIAQLLSGGATGPMVKGPIEQQQMQQEAQQFDLANIQQQQLAQQLQGQKENKLASLLSDAFTPESKKLARRKDARDTEKLLLQKDAALLPIIQPMVKESNAARANIKRFDEIERLTKKGDLDHPLVIGMVDYIKDHFGLDFTSSLLSPDTEAYRKLENDFVKNIKDVFGGARITDLDLRTFMKTVPTLMNSPEGRLQIVELFKDAEKAKTQKLKIAQKILDQYPDINPTRLLLKIENRYEDFLDKQADKVKDIINGSLQTDAEDDPLRYPEMFEDGTEYEEGNKTYRLTNGSWKEIK